MLEPIALESTVDGRRYNGYKCSYCGKSDLLLATQWARTHQSCGCQNRRKPHALSARARYHYNSVRKNCDPRWLDPQAFAEDLLPIPNESTMVSLRRFDSSAPYSKANCHWATTRRQTPTFTTGQRKGYWTILGVRLDGMYMVRCVCGAEDLLSPYVLSKGNRASCGCQS